MTTARQLPLPDPAAARIVELQEALRDAIDAGVRQADICLELMGELGQVCDSCRAIIEAGMGEVG